MMEIKTLDGIKIFVLPDNARCAASDGFKSPCDLEDCPTGCEVCYTDGCINYMEITEGE